MTTLQNDNDQHRTAREPEIKSFVRKVLVRLSHWRAP
jgi:hypothetical protein